MDKLGFYRLTVCSETTICHTKSSNIWAKVCVLQRPGRFHCLSRTMEQEIPIYIEHIFVELYKLRRNRKLVFALG